MANIEIEATSSASGSGTSLAWNHTCAGNSRLLVVGLVFNYNSDVLTAATYNSVALTSVNVAVQGATVTHLLYQANPASGTHEISLTFGASLTGINGAGVSLFNYMQGTAYGARDTSIASGTSIDGSLTTVRNFEIVIMAAGSNKNATASTNATEIIEKAGGGKEIRMFRATNTPISAPTAVSLTATYPEAGDHASVTGSFASLPVTSSIIL